MRGCGPGAAARQSETTAVSAYALAAPESPKIIFDAAYADLDTRCSQSRQQRLGFRGQDSRFSMLDTGFSIGKDGAFLFLTADSVFAPEGLRRTGGTDLELHIYLKYL